MPCCKEKNIQINEEKTYDDDGIIKIYENLENHEGKIIEGLPSLGDIKDQFEKPFNKMKDGINKMGNEIKDKFEEIPRLAREALKKDPLNGIVGSIIDFGEKINKAFTEIPRRFSMFGQSFDQIFSGIGELFDGLFNGIGYGFKDIGTLFNFFGIFMKTYLECGVRYIENLPSCIIYYLIDALLRLCYLPITIALWVVKSFTGKDMYYIEDIFWGYMWKLNGYIYSFAKFNILKWPKSIRDQCYNCKRLKVSAMERIANQIDYDFNTGIKDEMNKGVNTIKGAANNFNNVFKV
jgi:hypothetical protein